MVGKQQGKGEEILTKPLPKMIDDIYEAIAESKAATAEAHGAAKEAALAAEKAEAAGVKAAEGAGMIATEKVAEVRKEFEEALNGLKKLMQTNIDQLSEKVDREHNAIITYINHVGNGGKVYNEAYKKPLTPE